MPELVRSIIGRFCELIGSHNHARRYELRLPLTISIQDSKTQRACLNTPPTISGYTRNISDTGLSLVLSSVHFGNRYLMDGALILRVQIEFPSGVISFVIAPVRYEVLDENQGDCGYLIGMRIKEITEQERRRLTQYVREARRSDTVAPKTSFAQNAQTL